MPVAHGTLLTPGGAPVRNAAIEVRLCVNGFDFDLQTEILSLTIVHTNRVGNYSITLLANELILPANTYYTITHPDGEVIKIDVPDGAGPYWIPEIAVETSPPLAATVHGIPAGGAEGEVLTRDDGPVYSAVWAAPSPSALLYCTQFEPDGETNYSTTSDILVAVDSTNIHAPFTAPASGRVLYRITAFGRATSGSMYWGLVNHSSGSPVGNSTCVNWNNALLGTWTVAVLITGLPAGNAFDFDFAFAASPGTAEIWAQKLPSPIPSNALGGPVVMEVWSA